MNISKLHGIAALNEGASEEQINAVHQHIKIPPDFLNLLSIANGFIFEDGMKVYSTDELIERNETFEVNKYAPGYIAIGDDSGGRCVLMSLITGEIGHVDQGSMNPKYMESAAISLQGWIDKNCQIDLG